MDARILAVCDAFDSMISEKSYQAALPIEKAVSELRRGAETQFDPRIVEAFVGLVEQGEISE